MFRRRHWRAAGGSIWLPPAVGLLIIWLVLVIARVNLPFLPGPVIHVLPVAALLLFLFRHHIRI